MFMHSSNIATAQVEEQVVVEVAECYTINQFIDKIIEVFVNKTPQTNE